eukprot:750101-Hanusia_phi.AAC.3
MSSTTRTGTDMPTRWTSRGSMTRRTSKRRRGSLSVSPPTPEGWRPPSKKGGRGRGEGSDPTSQRARRRGGGGRSDRRREGQSPRDPTRTEMVNRQLTVQNPEVLERAVAEVRENTIATTTRSVYANSMIRFIQFLYVNESSLISRGLKIDLLLTRKLPVMAEE